MYCMPLGGYQNLIFPHHLIHGTINFRGCGKWDTSNKIVVIFTFSWSHGLIIIKFRITLSHLQCFLFSFVFLGVGQLNQSVIYPYSWNTQLETILLTPFFFFIERFLSFFLAIFCVLILYFHKKFKFFKKGWNFLLSENMFTLIIIIILFFWGGLKSYTFRSPRGW